MLLPFTESKLVSYVFEGRATAGIKNLPLDQALRKSIVSPLSLVQGVLGSQQLILWFYPDMLI